MSGDLSFFLTSKKTTGQDIQLIDPIWSHEVREGRRRWGWWRGGGAASPAMVVMMTSALPQRHYVLEADVRLRGVVDAVGDRHHGNRIDGAACGPVTATH